MSRVRCSSLVGDRDGWGSLGRRQCDRNATVILTQLPPSAPFGMTAEPYCRQHARKHSATLQSRNIRHTLSYRPNSWADRSAVAAWDDRARRAAEPAAAVQR